MTDYSLTKREWEVVELLLQAKSNKQIAQALHITEHTVEYHLQHIYAKLGVDSRTAAIIRLGNTPVPSLEERLGVSVVAPGDQEVDNGDNPVFGMPGPSVEAADMNQPAASTPSRRLTIPFLIGIGVVLLAVLSVLAIYFLRQPGVWKSYERECENSDQNTVGQAIWRSNASGSRVLGQFGSAAAEPWGAQSGYAVYESINLPAIDALYLKLRYSKHSPASVPIQVFIDNETTPRASVFLVDQGNWNLFTWTGPVYLGEVSAGPHVLRLFTEGQQYGVADLDHLILTRESP